MLGIPVSKPLFGMMWVLTGAQLELLTSDTSLVVYPKRKKEKSSKSKGKHQFETPSKAKLDKAAEKWRQKYEGTDGTVNAGFVGDYTLRQ